MKPLVLFCPDCKTRVSLPRPEATRCLICPGCGHALALAKWLSTTPTPSNVRTSRSATSSISSTPPTRSYFSSLYREFIDRRRVLQEVVTLLLLVLTLGLTGYYWFQGPRHLLNDSEWSSRFSLEEDQVAPQKMEKSAPPPQLAWNPWESPWILEPHDSPAMDPILEDSSFDLPEFDFSPLVLQAATLLSDEQPLREAAPDVGITESLSTAPSTKPVGIDLKDDSTPPRNSPPERTIPKHSGAAEERIIVGDSSGRAIVSRLYARGEDRVVVQLPDGSLGWANGAVKTTAPFVPWTHEEVRDNLLQGPYQDFLAVEEEHYLVLYQKSRRSPFETDTEAQERQNSIEAFARQSARLLEDLFDQLVDRLERLEFEVHEPEFPLVVVIFRDEEEFHAYRKVAADVRAYYEIYSNRIFLYETSDRDRQAPDLAAMRRPQMIAHEGTHQILQNIGVQPRLAAWPAWLVEGLAEYCAPATARPGWDGPRFGRVNPFHMATLIDLQENMLRGHLRSEGLFGLAQSSRGQTSSWIENLLTAEELSPTDYSLAWALSHYLMTRQPNEFLQYLKSMSNLDPLESRTPEQQLADFRQAFGQEFKVLARRVSQHLSRLDYETVPFYAVLFEQAMPPGFVRREGYVTQSIPMIYHWVNVRTSREAGPVHWRAVPHASRNQAKVMTSAWIDQP